MNGNRARFIGWPSLTGRRIELDFVRGVAILLACGWHFNQVPTGVMALDLLLAPGRRMGWAGVDLFFVLSGFLIGGLLFSEFERTGGFRPGRFLIRRALKIWPVLYAFLFLQLILHQHPWQSYFFQCLFHVQNFFPTPLSHLWSLAVEEQFYLAFAILYAVILRIGGSPRLMACILAGLMIFTLIDRSTAVMVGIDGAAMMQTQFRIDALACGMVLSYLHHFRPAIFEDMCSRKFVLFLIWVTGCWITSTHFVFGRFTQSIGYTIVYISAAAFLLFCYGFRPLVAASRPVRLMSQLGLYSYAIYVCQYAAVRPASAFVQRMRLPDPSATIIRIGLEYAGACAAGMIVTILVERPILALRNRRFPDRGGAVTVDAAASDMALPAASLLYPAESIR